MLSLCITIDCEYIDGCEPIDFDERNNGCEPDVVFACFCCKHIELQLHHLFLFWTTGVTYPKTLVFANYSFHAKASRVLQNVNAPASCLNHNPT